MFFGNFRGGVNPKDNKLTRSKRIENAKIPPILSIPLKQHIGQECRPVVDVGEHVRKYQKIGDIEDGLGACVHASSSGKVIAIEKVDYPCWGKVTSVLIKTDHKDKPSLMKPKKNPSSKEIIDAVKEAGIVGLGGAAFPTHVKLSSPKRPDYLIINGCECEPYITSDHRLMLEYGEEIIKGIKLMLKALGIKKAIIGIEDNKKDAISTMISLLKDDKRIGVHELKAKYPQGAEKILIDSVIGRRVPPGKLPIDIGVVVQNVATAFAVYEAVELGKPLIKRVVTVTGKVKNPKNLFSRIGTPIDFLIAECGGPMAVKQKTIMGGSMMGLLADPGKDSLIKSNNCILVLEDKGSMPYDKCIRCGHCIKACPVRIMPALIARNVMYGRIESAEKLNAMVCFECGSCSFVCPSNIPLLDYVKIAKDKIIKNGKACK